MKTGVCKKRCRTTYFEFQIGEKCNYDVAEVPRYKDKIDICVKIYNYLMASVGSEWDYENYYLLNIETFYEYFYTEKEVRLMKLNILKNERL